LSAAQTPSLPGAPHQLHRKRYQQRAKTPSAPSTNFITLSLPLSAFPFCRRFTTPSIGTYNPAHRRLVGHQSSIQRRGDLGPFSGQVSPNTVASNILSSVTVHAASGVARHRYQQQLGNGFKFCRAIGGFGHDPSATA